MAEKATPLSEHPSDCGCSACITRSALWWRSLPRPTGPPKAKTDFNVFKVF